MKAFWIVLIILFVAVVINAVRGGATFPVVQALPFLGGHRPGSHDFGASAMIVITIWGIRKMLRSR